LIHGESKHHSYSDAIRARSEKMDYKNDSRTFEDDLFCDHDDIVDDEIASNEAPPAYSSLSTEDLPLSPTYSDEKHESFLLEGTEDRKAVAPKEEPLQLIQKYIDTDRFSVDLSAGNRTSSSLHTLSTPTQRPRIIDIPTKTSTSMSPVGKPKILEATAKLKNVTLNIVLMLVGSRGESHLGNAHCLLYR
jgi:hypothetical protein